MNEFINKKRKQQIINTVDSTGVKHSSVGYKYLITCVESVLLSGDRCFKVKDIYEKVANIHNVRWITIERAIRIAIKKANEDIKKKTNKEVISIIVDKIIYEND